MIARSVPAADGTLVVIGLTEPNLRRLLEWPLLVEIAGGSLLLFAGADDAAVREILDRRERGQGDDSTNTEETAEVTQ